jgi:hypothetical protein
MGVVVLVLRVLPLAFRSAPAEQRAERTDLYLPFVPLLLARLLHARLLHGRGDAANLNGQQRERVGDRLHAAQHRISWHGLLPEPLHELV